MKHGQLFKIINWVSRVFDLNQKRPNTIIYVSQTTDLKIRLFLFFRFYCSFSLCSLKRNTINYPHQPNNVHDFRTRYVTLYRAVQTAIGTRL